MSMSDTRGVSLGTADRDAARAFDLAISSFAAHRKDLARHLDSAVVHDPDLILAHVLRGFSALLMARDCHDARALLALTAARSSLARRSGDWRTHMMVDALAAAAGRDVAGALARLDAVLDAAPRDLLTFKVMHAIRFQHGLLAESLRLSTALLPRWSREEAGTGYLLGCHAFALCEGGRLFEARRAALDALRLAPRDSWAAHALVHVLEMSGQADKGLAWIDAYAPDSVQDGLAQHLAWHRALFLIDLGRVRDALDIFDHSVWRTPSMEYRDIANAVSLLWRIEETGQPVGERWQSVVAACEALLHESGLGFARIHAVLGLLRAHAMIPPGAAATSSQPARSIIQALCALADDRDDAGAALLAGSRQNWESLGGSQAQRDLFTRIAVYAAISAERRSLARELLAERCLRFRGERWLTSYMERLALAPDRSARPAAGFL
jgi:tetratricopeptide (TPR) repeat protein